MTILVTGGAGYVGAHTVVELLRHGYEVVVVDSLINGSKEALRRVEEISGRSIHFFEGDLRDRAFLDEIFLAHSIVSVIHLAGLKAVAESVKNPLKYYDANVCGSIVLFQAMASAGVRNLVFSSSATVYGLEAPIPYVETVDRGKALHPYGNSKAIVEQFLTDLCSSDERWSVVILRYFNPIGAHPSGLIGEDPRGIPNNLMPFISQVAVGRRPELSIYGSDYPTKDGTCIRDYLHVVDLALGHVTSLFKLKTPGIYTYNLGTGQGASVLDVVRTFESVTGEKVPYHFADRRDGDLAAFWADVRKAGRELDWRAERSLEDMVQDTWRWQRDNPHGYIK
ncbi:UDP-galactose 4-epimerase [Onishia taeanensis]|uniref:UDP-glucose 4-epimerase n=1 Tax=Onishia taeanensis TaxID=284577 RepID=A0A328XF68_9GAMM|nr:UDP-glucose 4-epimerase GalE [Halomonas taeanensis]RAR56811.1 UDP-galactose 4-epimerase [Halomonas taeanensis]